MEITNDKKIEILNRCFNDIIWMAIRYADGRHTYAPGMVRDAIKDFQKVNPDWKPKLDITINKPKIINIGTESDYLYDLFEHK